MFDTLCTYPLPSDLFALAIHPTSPLLALGLASGHVQLSRLPASPTNPTPPPPAASKKKAPPAINTISTTWSTHRHKGSCRSLAFSRPNGTHLFSAGTDSIVKLADTETGRVVAKIAVPPNISSRTGAASPDLDPPTLLHVFSPTCLLLATESTALFLYDVREGGGASVSARPQQTWRPHADYVTSVTTLLPPSFSSSSSSSSSSSAAKTSNGSAAPTQFLSTGATTVAITDIRRGTLVQSESQNEELLSSALCGDKVVVGGERGVLRIWRVGEWDDNEVEVDVAPRGGGGASADVLAVVSEEEGDGVVAVGMDDGNVRFVDLQGRKGKVVVGEEVRHDEIEGVGGLGFLDGDFVDRRMISGGGSVVKIWEERAYGDQGESEEDDIRAAANGKRREGSDVEEDDDDPDDRQASDDEDEEPKRKRRKRKRGKGKGPASKQVMKFTGLG